jgi:hypothetical protein
MKDLILDKCVQEGKERRTGKSHQKEEEEQQGDRKFKVAESNANTRSLWNKKPLKSKS